jgi:hypothetical protein
MPFSLAKPLAAAPEINLDPWSEAWVTTIQWSPKPYSFEGPNGSLVRKKRLAKRG